MRLFLADGTIRDIRPGSATLGYVITRFEMTHEDIKSAWDKESLNRWLLDAVYPRMGRPELRQD